MVQAAFSHTTSLSRRAALAGLSVAAAVRPALAASTADTELLALGRQCDGFYARLAELSAAFEPRQQEYDRRIQPFIEACRRGEIDGDELADRMIAVRAETGTEGDGGIDDLRDAMHAPLCRIIELPARSIAGLAVKARAAACACEHYWNTTLEGADWDHAQVRGLIEAILAMAGQSLPFDCSE